MTLKVVLSEGGPAVVQVSAGTLMLAFFVWGVLMGLAGVAAAALAQGGYVAEEVLHRRYRSAAAFVGRRRAVRRPHDDTTGELDDAAGRHDAGEFTTMVLVAPQQTVPAGHPTHRSPAPPARHRARR